MDEHRDAPGLCDLVLVLVVGAQLAQSAGHPRLHLGVVVVVLRRVDQHLDPVGGGDGLLDVVVDGEPP